MLTLLCSMSWKSTSFTDSTWSPSCSPALCASESGITCEGQRRGSSTGSVHGQYRRSLPAWERQPGPRDPSECPCSAFTRRRGTWREQGLQHPNSTGRAEARQWLRAV